jgi:hypothetical protein
MKRFPHPFSLLSGHLLVAASLSGLAIAPLASHADTALDSRLTCRQSAHAFISGLMEQRLIKTSPMRIASDSINAFSPASGQKLTAYGFSVFAVVGFQQDDPLFQHGDGKPVGRSAYGAVVFGSTSSVKAALDAAGNTAPIVHHVNMLMTAIFCQQK